MVSPKLLFILALLFLFSPLVVAIALALLWLDHAGFLLYGLIAFATSYIIGWRLLSRATRRQKRPYTPLGGEIAPEEFWGELEHRCWEGVVIRARSIELGDEKLSDVSEVQSLFLSLLTDVATSFFPLSTQPILEVKVEDLFLVIEHAAQELRTEYISQIPLHNLLTVNEILRAKRGWDTVQKLFDAYRAVRPMANPLSALIHEVRALLARGAITRVSDNTTHWFKARMVELVGKQLINLYSGNVIDRSKFTSYQAKLPTFEEGTPITIAVVGEVNAGKSSVINALFGSTRTPSYHLPETQGEIWLEKELEGVGKVVLVDSKGYGESKFEESKLQKLIFKSDAVLLVTAANAAARNNDLSVIRLLMSLPIKERPPFLVVLTKVDLMRPKRSWNPPYDLIEVSVNQSEENRQKATNIKEAVLEVARQFEIDSSLIVPVYTQSPDTSYNIDLLGVMLHDVLPEARRMVLRRLLAAYRDEHYWQELKDSIAKGGRLIIGAGAKGAARVLGHLG